MSRQKRNMGDFEKLVRKHMIDNGFNSFKDLAEDIGVSTSTLTNVVVCKAKSPDEVINKLIGFFDLKPNEVKKLNGAYVNQSPIVFDVTGLNVDQKDLVVTLQEVIGELDEVAVARVNVALSSPYEPEQFDQEAVGGFDVVQ